MVDPGAHAWVTWGFSSQTRPSVVSVESELCSATPRGIQEACNGMHR